MRNAPDPPLDIFVIGGGINGAGIARDAAGRGLRVALCEQGDLASATSQASSKLIHGGLRYLERLELRLVRESLRERERLLHNAPHLVRPTEFLLPQTGSPRPAWMVRTGLWLYDHLKGRSVLPRSHTIELCGTTSPLLPEHRHAFVYPDCRVDDARLVILTAVDAASRGCSIWTHTRCVAAERRAGAWHVTLEAMGTGQRSTIQTRSIVNAAGPWVTRWLDVVGIRSARRIRLLKGSHIVVPRIAAGNDALLLQNDDGRVVFVIPFEDAFTLIGTTEVATAEPEHPECSAAETEYLCLAANRYLRTRVSPGDVLWSFAGVRPLVEDASKDASRVTRDYAFELDERDGLPLLSVFGGKLTTYRRLAERAIERVRPWLPGLQPSWTANAPLPGGDVASFAVLYRDLVERFPRLDPELLKRLARRHGTRTHRLLRGVQEPRDLGEHVGAHLWAREVRWLVEHEWATTVEDVIWRRSKAGLVLTAPQTERLAELLDDLRRTTSTMPSA